MVLDFETTGPDPYACRPVSFALATVMPGFAAEGRHELVDCGVDVPLEATAIHGISTEDVRARGISPDEMVAWIVGEIGSGLPLVVFNAPFDWTLLLEEVARTGSGIAVPEPRIIDPLVIDQRFDKYRKGSRKLDAQVAHYCPGFGLNAHDALGDCLGAAAVLREQLRRYNLARDEVTPERLHELQVGWHHARIVDYNDYRKRKGDPPVAGGWPVQDRQYQGSPAETEQDAAVREIRRLADWILANRPDEIGAGDLQNGESAVDIAIRLMAASLPTTRVHAAAALTEIPAL